jgi:hypothetical protein
MDYSDGKLAERRARIRVGNGAEAALLQSVLESLRRDRVAHGHEDLDCRRSDRHVARLSWFERTGADRASATAILQPCVCISWPRGDVV